jgi:hypothetical protein
MGKILRIRGQEDLWWHEIPYEQAIAWDSFTILWVDDNTCFISVNGEKLELKRSDYDKVVNDRMFNLKFGIKKHSF